MEQNFVSLIDNAQIQCSGVQVNPAIVLMLFRIVSHDEFLPDSQRHCL